MITLDLFPNISSSSALAPNLHFVQKSKSFSVIGTTFHKGDHVSLGYLHALYSSGPPTRHQFHGRQFFHGPGWRGDGLGDDLRE